ncbi:MAG: hypothetical protein ACK4SF_12410 [Algoriphagus aquaeductus]|uniref:hypothetical protein n=1 Tax=Algoriphagus TaxID=246875 RepID=UPI00258C5F33|nr:hypothetical protein [Algoriphagus sp.]
MPPSSPPDLSKVGEGNKTPLKSTISIPTSLFHTKKLVEEKNNAPDQVVVEKRPEVAAPTIIQESVTLTQEMLDQVIHSVKDFYRQANKNFELAILDQPIQVLNGEVNLQVMGSVQEEIANKMRPELLGLIRKLTGANQLSISVEHKEEIEDSRPKLYTNTDKLRFLRDKHPALAEFQRKFDLDVDF